MLPGGAAPRTLLHGLNNKVWHICLDFFTSGSYKLFGFSVMPLPPAECKVYTPPSLAEAMVSAIH
jgi:hypothetical protein